MRFPLGPPDQLTDLEGFGLLPLGPTDQNMNLEDLGGSLQDVQLLRASPVPTCTHLNLAFRVKHLPPSSTSIQYNNPKRSLELNPWH